jgi:hypothetical protein
MTPPPRGVPAARLGRAFAVSTMAAAAGSLGSATACSSSPQVITAADAYGMAGPEPLDAEGGLKDTGAPDVITAADAYGLASPEPVDLEGGPKDTGVPEILTAGDAYGTVEPFEAGPDVLQGGAAYGVAEPTDGGASGH